MVRDMVDRHLPEQYRRKPAYRHVSTDRQRNREAKPIGWRAFWVAAAVSELLLCASIPERKALPMQK
jgi:hypothetical protein